MFNKYFIQLPNEAGTRDIARSIRDHSKTLADISRDEIKSKDRVNIPLSEYTEMKDTIDKQERELRMMRCYIRQLGIPQEDIDSIDPDTIRVYRNRDLCKFATHYHITFTVDETLGILRRNF